MKIYTIKDIAQKAGVSVTTVSRVLNHRPDVNRETREKVERVMAACHFVGNANARGLKQTEGDLVAIIIRGHQNPFLNALAESILQHTKDCRAAFLTEFIDEKADEFQTALRLLHERRVNGFIFVGSRIDQRAHELSGLDLPMVFTTVSAQQAGLPSAASVAIDDRAMGRLATQVLLERGHRKIAVFGASRTGSDSRPLCSGSRYFSAQRSSAPPRSSGSKMIFSYSMRCPSACRSAWSVPGAKRKISPR